MPNDYYYSHGRKIPVTRLQSARVVRVPEDRDEIVLPGWHTLRLGAKGYQLLVRADVIAERALAVFRLEGLSERLLQADRELAERRTYDDLEERMLREALPDEPAPVLLTADDGLLLPTGEVIAQIRPDIQQGVFEESVRTHGGVITGQVEFLQDTYLLRPTNGGDGIDLANALVEAKVVTFASPNFIEEMPPRGVPSVASSSSTVSSSSPSYDLHSTRSIVSPPNSRFRQQWHLHNTGQGGGRPAADVRALAAWEITLGSPDIVVAIVDSGIASDHEAFTAPGKLTPGFDFEDDDIVSDPTSSSHGTSCAGVVAAPWGRGEVLGIAPNCRIMPIRRAALSEHLKMAQAFAWAAANGADVISCSFGYDNRPWILPDVVRIAIDQAVGSGRNGKGCVIVWAAGNGNETVESDEWASNDKVIAVAASTDQDVRAWYSDFGQPIHICAPSSGGFNGITTTHNDGYTNAFGGTSSAAPLAAGIIALILSLNPNLTASAVKALLRNATDQIDPANGNYDVTGHSDWYGYGRLNAHKALLAIPILAEATRGTNVEARLPLIQAFITNYLKPRSAGRSILQFLANRRFQILNWLVTDTIFRADSVIVLRLVADAYEALQRGGAISTSQSFWDAIARVIERLISGSDAVRDEISVNGEENPMATQKTGGYGTGGGNGGERTVTASTEGERMIPSSLAAWLVHQIQNDPDFLKKLQEKAERDAAAQGERDATGNSIEGVLNRVVASITERTVSDGERDETGSGRPSASTSGVSSPADPWLEQLAESVSNGVFRAIEARTERAGKDGENRALSLAIPTITFGIIYEPPETVRGRAENA